MDSALLTYAAIIVMGIAVVAIDYFGNRKNKGSKHKAR